MSSEPRWFEAKFSGGDCGICGWGIDEGEEIGYDPTDPNSAVDQLVHHECWDEMREGIPQPTLFRLKRR